MYRFRVYLAALLSAWPAYVVLAQISPEGRVGLPGDPVPEARTLQLPNDAINRFGPAQRYLPARVIARRLNSHAPYAPSDIVYDNYGQFYVIHDDLFLMVYSAESGELVGTLWFGGETILSLTWSPAHRRVYVGLANGDIRFFDPPDVESTQYFATLNEPVVGLSDAGDHLLAIGESGSRGNHYSFSKDTALRDYEAYNFVSPVFAWNTALHRVYYFRENLTPNDLHYEFIDPATGEIGPEVDSPYHGQYAMQPPILVSADGGRLLLGNGNVFDAQNLQFLGDVGYSFAAGAWTDSDETVVLSEQGESTQLERRLPNGRVIESYVYPGVPQALIPVTGGFSVLTAQGNEFSAFQYIPSDDGDGDDVPNVDDAFPLDPAASVDTDGDGYPDFWNPGMTQADSTTGLALDAYPTEASCYLPEHGDGVSCDFSATLPDYVPDQIAMDGSGVLHLLSRENRKIYRWDSGVGAYMRPVDIGVNDSFPLAMEFHPAHGRIYLGYDDGSLSYLAQSAPEQEVLLHVFAGRVEDFAVADDDLIVKAQDGGQRMFALDSAGAVLATSNASCYGDYLEWDAALKRVYSTYVGCTPADIVFSEYDPQANTFGSSGSSPYHGNFAIQGPVRVSPDGARVVTGAGDVYSAQDLRWAQTMPFQVVDFSWSGTDSVSLSQIGGLSVLQRRSSKSVLLEERTFEHVPTGLFAINGGYVVVTQSAKPSFYRYELNDDIDGDGFQNFEDAFPEDPAAAMDGDRDGYPEMWLPGMDQTDSTTGLTLDAYPGALACYLPEHGDGVKCDYESTIPSYQPDDAFVDGSGVVHLLSRDHSQIYRWSSATNAHMDPLVVGRLDGLQSDSPTLMAFHHEQKRIYLGYAHGLVTYLDQDVSNAEQTLNAFSGEVQSLVAAGDDLIVAKSLDVDGGNLISLGRDGIVLDNFDTITGRIDGAVWNAKLSRMYFLNGTNNVHFQQYDPAENEFGIRGSSPHHFDYVIRGPIRPSNDGADIALGSGDLYSGESLTWRRSVPVIIVDMVWIGLGQTVSITQVNQSTVLQRRSADLRVKEQLTIDAPPVALFETKTGLIVVTQGEHPRFTRYLPSNDTDGDGVPNDLDAFPNDPAASQDTDGDGYPDRWNPRQLEENSTTGLVLDAYPSDSACQLPEHGAVGNESVCDLVSTILPYVPEATVSDAGGIIYLLSPNENKVYRWDQQSAAHLNPIIVGQLQLEPGGRPTSMAYSELHDRLYFGYLDGSITYVDTQRPMVEREFASAPASVYGVAAVGNFVLAQDFSGSGSSHFIYDVTGDLRDFVDSTYYSVAYAWNESLGRVYFFRNGSSPGGTISPNDLHFESIDPQTGEFNGGGETPYHNDFQIVPPIRVSPDESRIMLGSGDVYDAQTMVFLRSVSDSFVDGLYIDGDQRLFLKGGGSVAHLERRTLDGVLLERASYPAEAIAIHAHEGRYTVVAAGDVPEFFVYVPNDDLDADSVPVPSDAFPDDPAASIDTDGDGYPDQWNEGSTADDSTTGLTLDAFPFDTSCYLDAHGVGGSCDYGATVPDFAPDQLLMDDHGMVYMLSRTHGRVFRWNASTGQYADAVVASIGSSLERLHAQKITFSNAHQRLYLGYSNGVVTYRAINSIDVEQPFTHLPDAVQLIASAGNYVFAQTRFGSEFFDYSFAQDGSLLDTRTYSTIGKDPVWNPQQSSVYFLRDSSNPRLYRREIDQQTGQIVGAGSSSGSIFRAPIRFSQDGSVGVSGARQFFDPVSFQILGFLPSSFTDAVFTPDDGTIVIRWIGSQTLVERRNSDGTILETRYFDSVPLAIFEWSTGYLLVGRDGRPVFSMYVPATDPGTERTRDGTEALLPETKMVVQPDKNRYLPDWH